MQNLLLYVSRDLVNHSSVYSIKSTCFLLHFISSLVPRRSNPGAEINEDKYGLFPPMSGLLQITLITT